MTNFYYLTVSALHFPAFHESLSMGLPHNMKTDFPSGSDPREYLRWSLPSFHNLMSEVTFFSSVFYLIKVGQQVPPTLKGRELHRT